KIVDMDKEDTSWLPSCFTVTDSNTDYVCIWVSNETDLNLILESHRRTALCSFVS
ncbi:hypothetical protein ScPMuIL_017315, partial [Solemya velum]